MNPAVSAKLMTLKVSPKAATVIKRILRKNLMSIHTAKMALIRKPVPLKIRKK